MKESPTPLPPPNNDDLSCNTDGDQSKGCKEENQSEATHGRHVTGTKPIRIIPRKTNKNSLPALVIIIIITVVVKKQAMMLVLVHVPPYYWFMSKTADKT